MTGSAAVRSSAWWHSLIDDLAGLTPEAQAQLYCLLEDRTLRETAAVDAGADDEGVRVIAGASHHLDAERAQGGFCEAVFYRLNVVHIVLMPQQAVDGPAALAGEPGESAKVMKQTQKV